MIDVTECQYVNHDDGRRNLFCVCGKVKDQAALKRVRLMGFHGNQSTSPAMEAFWASGDPTVFSKPGDPDYTPGVSMG